MALEHKDEDWYEEDEEGEEGEEGALCFPAYYIFDFHCFVSKEKLK